MSPLRQLAAGGRGGGVLRMQPTLFYFTDCGAPAGQEEAGRRGRGVGNERRGMAHALRERQKGANTHGQRGGATTRSRVRLEVRDTGTAWKENGG